MNGRTHKPKAYRDYIVRDKRICSGEPVFKGTRVTLRTVLASLADSDSPEKILEASPKLKAGGPGK